MLQNCSRHIHTPPSGTHPRGPREYWMSAPALSCTLKQVAGYPISPGRMVRSLVLWGVVSARDWSSFHPAATSLTREPDSATPATLLSRLANSLCGSVSWRLSKTQAMHLFSPCVAEYGTAPAGWSCPTSSVHILSTIAASLESLLWPLLPSGLMSGSACSASTCDDVDSRKPGPEILGHAYKAPFAV